MWQKTCQAQLCQTRVNFLCWHNSNFKELFRRVMPMKYQPFQAASYSPRNFLGLILENFSPVLKHLHPAKHLVIFFFEVLGTTDELLYLSWLVFIASTILTFKIKDLRLFFTNFSSYLRYRSFVAKLIKRQLFRWH